SPDSKKRISASHLTGWSLRGPNLESQSAATAFTIAISPSDKSLWKVKGLRGLDRATRSKKSWWISMESRLGGALYGAGLIATWQKPSETPQISPKAMARRSSVRILPPSRQYTTSNYLATAIACTAPQGGCESGHFGK